MPLALAAMVLAGSTRASFAAPAVGRSSASSSASVSITIPKITGIDVTAPAQLTVANQSARVNLSVFQTGEGAILIRTAPQGSPNPLQRASFRTAAPSSQIIAATGSGWQMHEDSPPGPPASRISTAATRNEVTYELWQF